MRARHLKIKKSSKDITNGVGLLNQIRQGMGVSEYTRQSKIRERKLGHGFFYTFRIFNKNSKRVFADYIGIEPMTSRLTARRSNR